MHTAKELLNMVATEAFDGDPRANPLVRPVVPLKTPSGKEGPTFQFNAELIKLPDGSLVWVG
jgi:hypothetical protein